MNEKSKKALRTALLAADGAFLALFDAETRNADLKTQIENSEAQRQSSAKYIEVLKDKIKDQETKVFKFRELRSIREDKITKTNEAQHNTINALTLEKQTLLGCNRQLRDKLVRLRREIDGLKDVEKMYAELKKAGMI